MKHSLALAALIVALVLAGNQKASAQNKFGVFDDKGVLSVMPGIGRVDTLLQIFQTDSLGAEKDFRTAEFYRNDSTLKADSVNLVKAHIYDTKKKELIQQFYLLQNWDQYAQQAMQGKQAQLLEPFQIKMGQAYQQVLKEGGYNWVFRAESVFAAPPADNLTLKVIAKLGIKLPQQQGQQEAPAQAAPRTAPKTAPKH